MERHSILYLLKSQNLTEQTLELFKEKLKDKNFTLYDCDMLLKRMGYESIFTEEDEFNDEDDYDDFEPISRKKLLKDE